MPDGLCEQAARRMLVAVAGLSEGDLVISLISGGGSALVSLPASGISLAEKQALNRALLRTDDSAPRRSDPGFARAADVLEAARAAAKAEGIEVRLLGDDLEGEARELGCAQGRLALSLRDGVQQPLLLLSGGETSVTVRGNGRGGRNVEYLLGLFEALRGPPASMRWPLIPTASTAPWTTPVRCSAPRTGRAPANSAWPP